jgi:cell wall-associated NlpC family hydrolase
MSRPVARITKAAAWRAVAGPLVLVLGLGGCATAPPETVRDDPLAGWIEAGAAADGAPHAGGEVPTATPPTPDASAAVHAPAVAPDAETRASALVISAMSFLGVRYRRGGHSAEQGFDCSGFTRHVFESSLGQVLPRRARDQAGAKELLPVLRDQLLPGDLVFFNTLRAAFSHVGIYIGDGKFIHAPRSGAEVRIEDMRLAYWTRRYDGARRSALAPQAGSTERSAASARF